MLKLKRFARSQFDYLVCVTDFGGFCTANHIDYLKFEFQISISIKKLHFPFKLYNSSIQFLIQISTSASFSFEISHTYETDRGLVSRNSFNT